MAYYRVKTLIAQGCSRRKTRANAVIIKTFVTTDLQKRSPSAMGCAAWRRLTGFKYIGEKLGKYEQALPRRDPRPVPARSAKRTTRQGAARSLELLRVRWRGELRLLGGGLHPRDKDGNGATVVFAEVAGVREIARAHAARAARRSVRRVRLLLWREWLAHLRGRGRPMKIAKLVASYAQHPPVSVDGIAVSAVRNFATETFHDIEGDKIPKENMISIELADGPPHRRPAERHRAEDQVLHVSAAGIPLGDKHFTKEELATIAPTVKQLLEDLWSWVQSDVAERLKVIGNQ